MMELLPAISHSLKIYLPLTSKGVLIFLTSAFPSNVKHMVYRRYEIFPIKSWEAHELRMDASETLRTTGLALCLASIGL